MQIVKARSKNTQLSEADYNLAEVRARDHVLIGRLNVIEAEYLVDYRFDRVCCYRSVHCIKHLRCPGRLPAWPGSSLD